MINQVVLLSFNLQFVFSNLAVALIQTRDLLPRSFTGNVELAELLPFIKVFETFDIIHD